MANRKVLINRHTSGSSAPVADSMYLGEIAIAHETGKETLFTKNNAGDMVPFISCAQTKTMIDNAIQEADVTYDVKAATSDNHVEVATAGTKEKVFTVSSKDVMSEDAFNEYSARTAQALDDLITVTVTGISGDSIIVATVVDPGTGSNAYNLTHKAGHESSGFNKLATDAYGHVTASTAVSTSDIEALGFKTSADTGDEIAAAIEALGAVSASTGKYFSAIGVKDGKLIKEELDLPVLSTAKTGTGNVVSDITVNGHQISFTTTSVATSEAIAELSGAVETFSAATYNEFSSAFTAINDLSADTFNYVNAVSGNIESVILAMDKAADAVAGQVVTTVAQEDGKVSETKANVKDLQLGGYVKDTTATGAIAGTDTINAALSKLENIVAANEISNADGSINVTTAATGTDINVNIKSGEHVLAKDGDAGLYTNIKLSALTPSSDLVKEEYALYGTDNTILGDHIKIYKDQSLASITLEDNDGSGHTGQYLKYTYIDASGATQSTYVNVSSFLVEAEFKSGVTADANGVVHGVVDPASEKDSNNDSFLTVGADGFKVDGIKDEIDAKIAALDKTDDVAVAGQYVAAIEETDGVVAVKTRANVSEAVLNNYTKGTDATAVAATDTVNQAISKLENQVVAAKAAATTKVVEGTDAGNNMTIVPTTGDDNSVTYTVNLTDVASKNALGAEIAARKAVDGQTGQTYAANTGTTYITGATSLNDADVKLDAALKAVSDKVDTSKVTEGSSVENFVTLTLDTATTAGTTALTINDSALKTKIDKINSTITAETKARQDAIADLDSTAQTSGNGYFLTSVQLADGKITAATQSDKVNSASTADEAVKVKNALSVSGYSTSSASSLDSAIAYDGFEAKSLTFGTNGPAGLKSMSMTSAGVVDVEVIDCGEY